MAKPLVLICLILLYAKGFTQTSSLKHPSTIGIHFILNDFKNSSLLGRVPNMDAGLSLGYLHGLSSRFDYTVSLAGSFPDSISEHLGSNEKSLFLQSDFSLRARLLGKTNWINPFAQAGLGIATYRSNLASYLLIGPGIEFNYKDVYLTTSFQYRVSLSNKLNNHYFYSIGIAGLIEKKEKKKRLVEPPKTQYVVVVTDRDGDGVVDSRCMPYCPRSRKIPGVPNSRP